MFDFDRRTMEEWSKGEMDIHNAKDYTAYISLVDAVCYVTEKMYSDMYD